MGLWRSQVAHRTLNPAVVGSNPSRPATLKSFLWTPYHIIPVNRRDYKLAKDDIESVTKDPYQLFLNSLTNESTRETYIRRLKRFLCLTLEDYLQGDKSLRERQRAARLKTGDRREIERYLDADFDVRVREFVDKARADSNWTAELMVTWSKKLKERTRLDKNDEDYLNPSSVPNHFKPIKKLLKAAGVPANWMTIEDTFPEETADDSTRAYTRQEITAGLRHADAMTAAAMLLYASSSIRRGGIQFQWQDIHPVYEKEEEAKAGEGGRRRDFAMGSYDDKYDITNPPKNIVCGIVTIYKGDKEQYFALCTPEAWHQIQTYKIEWHQQTGRQPKPEHPFLKKDGILVRELVPDAMAKRISDTLMLAQVRKPGTQNGRRHKVPLLNGYRRWFDATASEALGRESTLASLIKRERMMGHTGLVKLDKNYFKTHWRELVAEYLKIVPALTISSDARKTELISRLEKEAEEKKDQNEENKTLIRNLEKNYLQKIDEMQQMLLQKQAEEESRERALQRHEKILNRLLLLGGKDSSA